jgi:hypothetical protein
MSISLIEKIYKDNRSLSEYLLTKGEVSFKSDLDDTFKKVLLLSTASFLETQLTELLITFASKATKACFPLSSFVENKAIKRQYHTYFNWEESNANHFFGLFGKEFMTQVKTDIHNNQDLDNAIKAFIEIGNERNKMVHENFASYTLAKTAEEVYILFNQSQKFITYLSQKFDSFIK